MVQILPLQIDFHALTLTPTEALAQPLCILQRRGPSLIVLPDLIELAQKLGGITDLEVLALDLVHLLLQVWREKASPKPAKVAILVGMRDQVRLFAGSRRSHFSVERIGYRFECDMKRFPNDKEKGKQ